MSAPRTNIDKEKRRHLTPLVGLGIAVVFGFLMFLLYMSNAFEGTREGDETERETQVTAPPGSEDVGAVDVKPTPGADASQAEDTNAETAVGD